MHKYINSKFQSTEISTKDAKTGRTWLLMLSAD